MHIHYPLRIGDMAVSTYDDEVKLMLRTRADGRPIKHNHLFVQTIQYNGLQLLLSCHGRK
jgi:hypothetical protein